MTDDLAIDVRGVSHAYGKRTALDALTISVRRREIFAFLGPNGGGKTTLFRLLSTLVPVQSGEVSVLGRSLPRETAEVRRRIGVVFQSPSLDKKLTVGENIRCQAALYGVGGRELRERQKELLEQLGLSDRVRERAETLSGGLRRRVEIAKAMIHRPQLLLMDEPSTGLDPGARSDMWRYLTRLRDEFGVTVVLTTHLLEEAEKADRIAIFNRGTLVALDTPDALRATVGGDSITVETDEPDLLAAEAREEFGVEALVLEGQVRFEQADGHQWVARLVEAFPGRVKAVRLGKPTLEDVFIAKTGRRFWDEEE